MNASASSLNVSAYGEGCMYPPSASQPVSTTFAQIQASGLTTVILSLMHIGRDYDISPSQITGDLYYNDLLIISQGSYVGDPTWIDPTSPNCINDLIGGSVTRVEMSVGGGGVLDFQTIQRIYEANANSFDGTNLQTNFVALKKTLPVVSLIDMDCEDNYDEASFVAFCQMLIAIGFSITFCPYTATSFWTNSLKAIEASDPGSVTWWNLQCYDGGAGNEPQQWADSITSVIPGFDTTGYILAGDWTNDSPQAVEQLMQTFSAQSATGGGFLWTIDSTISGGTSDLAAYVSAIQSGLGS